MLDPLLENRFSALRAIPERDQQAADYGRGKFLAQAQKLKQAVSFSTDRRHYGWIDLIHYTFRNKERSPMFVTVTSILMAVIFILGGSGAAVYAAQDSLPNEPLYEVKILNEDFMLRLQSSEEKNLQMELDFARRRVDEMASLSLMGEDSPESVLSRLENHLDQALNLAARTGEGKLSATMSQIRESLREQLRILEQSPQIGQIMRQAREALQLRLQWADLGVNEPLIFQAQARNRNRFNQSPEPSPPGSGSQSSQGLGESGYGPGPNYQQGQNDGGYGPGPNYEQGQNQGSFGPGPNLEQEQNQGGYGPGPNYEQEQNQGGYGPGSDNDPEPNEAGYGPGPGPDSSCTANCDSPCSGDGPDPDQTQIRERDADQDRDGKP